MGGSRAGPAGTPEQQRKRPDWAEAQHVRAWCHTCPALAAAVARCCAPPVPQPRPQNDDERGEPDQRGCPDAEIQYCGRCRTGMAGGGAGTASMAVARCGWELCTGRRKGPAGSSGAGAQAASLPPAPANMQWCSSKQGAPDRDTAMPISAPLLLTATIGVGGLGGLSGGLAAAAAAPPLPLSALMAQAGATLRRMRRLAAKAALGFARDSKFKQAGNAKAQGSRPMAMRAARGARDRRERERYAAGPPRRCPRCAPPQAAAARAPSPCIHTPSPAVPYTCAPAVILTACHPRLPVLQHPRTLTSHAKPATAACRVICRLPHRWIWPPPPLQLPGSAGFCVCQALAC